MIALTPIRRVTYLAFGLPAIYLTYLAPMSIHFGLWAYFENTDTSAYSFIYFVVTPVIGGIATLSALLLLVGPGKPSEKGRLIHTGLLISGVAVAITLSGPTNGFWFSLFVLSPAVVAILLIRHLWRDTQQR